MDVVATELRRLLEEPIGEEELDRAKDNVKGRTVLAMESTLARMNRLGSSVLMGVPLLELDDLLAAVDAVSSEDVSRLARELLAAERLSAAGVGGEEERFRSAIGAVAPELAAA
jgi:predicted Zn-dependent peptidase